jgi:type II secretory pathway pseudopilin PulG
MRRASGFSLIELVMIIIIIGIVSAGFVSAFSTSTMSLNTNEILQQATQFAQECAERAVAKRQEVGYSAFPTTFSCSDPNADFTRTVVVGNEYTNSGACPAGVKCRNVTITVTSTINHDLSSPITIMLADY